MHDESTPDWKVLVRERLLPLGLPEQEEQQVVAELAAHLEDCYEEQIETGVSESAACETKLNELFETRRLAKNIQRAKYKEELMNPRTKQLWLPSLVSLTAAMGSLMILILISLQPRFLGRSPLQMVLLPWLALLPFCGAAGAWLSRRGGADLVARVVSGLFPMIVLFSLVGTLIVTRLIVLARPHLPFISIWIALGIILPSAALLIGAAPFLKATKSKGIA
ncbi:MAG TPA: hypothetical protein VK788_12935 [Terriglobales bacterium]|jgi:hypothetical protein|nr:hypothetical protein [Terriglobales bacterium]